MQYEAKVVFISFLKLRINTQKYVKLDDATDNLISTLTKIVNETFSKCGFVKFNSI